MEIKCPHCGANYEVEKNELGTNADCLECGKTFMVGHGSIRHVQEQDTSETDVDDVSPSGNFFSFLSINNINLLNFKGRAGRSEWWGMTVGTLLVFSMLIFRIAKKYWDTWDDDDVLIIGIITILVFEILTIHINVRRLHDRNMSAWWNLLFSLLDVMMLIIGFPVKFIILGCLDGTPGDNDYGPDPKGRQSLHPVVRTPVYPQPSARTTESPEDRLMKLMKLKEAGVLTDEEYEIRRMRLVASLDE